MGLGLLALSPLFGGSDTSDLLCGLLFGISIGTILVGVFLLARSIFAYLA